VDKNLDRPGDLMKIELGLSLLLGLSLASTAQQDNHHKAFFENLKKMCGQQLEGETVFPQNADHPLVGKRLVMKVGPCTTNEVRIPFDVAEDKSRTWIVTLTDQGLLFKHDHRHEDGTPDKITMYGGWATTNGTALVQRFPADAETTKLIPEAGTNVWTLEMVLDKPQFVYSLERNNAPRYKALFNSRPTGK
jgi:hypothetical protein